MIFDFDNEKPIYVQIVEQLMIAIISGKYKSGEKIPSVRELALTAKVNPNTMQKALTELENKKLIYTERTNGKYVTSDKKLLDNEKKKLAKKLVDKYLNDMQNLGVSFDDCIYYLQELGGK